MAEINKIRLNGNNYNIVPQLGEGLISNNGVVEINTSKGFSFNEEGKIEINIGSGLVCDEAEGKIGVCLGTAKVIGNSSANSGITIGDSGFVINPDNFKAFLTELGVQFVQE